MLPGESERVRRENAEKVIEITKWAFVHAMSIIEISVKDAVRSIDPNILKSIETRKSGSRKRVFIYLRDVVKELENRESLSNVMYDNWVTLIIIRNLVVHNNAIADSDMVLHIDSVEIRLRAGQMIRGKLDFFIKLIDYAVESYRRTLEALLSSKSR